MDMAGSSYEDLEHWQRAMDLVVECYTLAKTFPPSEAYGLSSQLQRAAVSVPANVAEGQARQHRGEFIQHLSIARGSLAEVRTHVRIAQRLKYIPEIKAAELLARCDEVGRLLHGLLRFLRNRDRGVDASPRKVRETHGWKARTEHKQPAAENLAPANSFRKPGTSNQGPATNN
jgi:four helix bundle protein